MPTDFDNSNDDLAVPAEQNESTFEAKMLQRVKREFSDSKEHVRKWHHECREMDRLYHNEQDYEQMKSARLFPVPFLKQQVDQFVADMLDKLYYRNQPCTLTGREEDDKGDAQAKQEMMNYQDLADDMDETMSMLLYDCAMYRACIAQVDFKDDKIRRRETRDVPVTRPNPITGEEEKLFAMDGQTPLTKRENVVVEDVIYMGPTVKRVHPTNVFFTQDKTNVKDDFPFLIRSFQPRSFFFSETFFFNQSKLGKPKGGKDDPGHTGMIERARALGLEIKDNTETRKGFEYVERFGKVNKRELYKYLKKPTRMKALDKFGTEVSVELVTKHEKAWAIIGVVDMQIVVRIDESPYDFDGPSVVMGVIDRKDDFLIGDSIANKAMAAQRGLDRLAGMLFSALKQSVARGQVINTNAIDGDTPTITDNNFVLETTGDVREVHKVIDMPRVSPDIHDSMGIVYEWGKDSTGLGDIISGRGDPKAETLGESQLVANQGALRLKKYLKAFERSLVIPLWSLRNQINMQFLQEDYVFGVVGKAGEEWRTVTPGQIRANVDFICESAARESNRAVITQQMLQFREVAVDVMNAGYPVRWDILAARLGEQGFTWSRDFTEEIIPSLKLEKDGTDINVILQEIMVLTLQGKKNEAAIAALGGFPAEPGQNGNSGGGGNSPQPITEGDAVTSANQRNATPVV